MELSAGATGIVLAFCAGLCTSLGGASVFFIRTFTPRPFAVCMALSSGVMLYVSLVDMLGESREHITRGLLDRFGNESNAKIIEAWSYLAMTLCFFFGWLLATIIDKGLHWVVDSNGMEQIAPLSVDKHAPCDVIGSRESSYEWAPDDVEKSLVDSARKTDSRHRKSIELTCTTKVGTCEADPKKNLDTTLSSLDSPHFEEEHAAALFRRDQQKFLRMGLMTAIVLGLHNAPEGVATFTGSLAAPRIGVGVAVAIGIHNIPEGFAVSVPMYFGTGNRWKSFMYSAVSGMAEPAGALIAWAALRESRDTLTLGLLFGIVCGIMAQISLVELYPAALKYDPLDRVTTVSLVAGMLIMAVSLTMFGFLM